MIRPVSHFAILAVRFRHAWLRTRLPFRYGIATMTEAPHVLVEVAIECGGRILSGRSAETWVPKWFVKQPDTTFAGDLADMNTVLEHAAAAARTRGLVSFSSWQRRFAAAQKEMLAPPRFPALLVQLGTAMLERAVLHALCQAESLPLHLLIQSGATGLDPAALRPEASGLSWRDILPEVPAESVAVRHTVGLTDPLTAADAADPPGDDLPHTLEDHIRAFGLTHFKIKLAGDRGRDASRLAQLASLLPPGARFTLDANENYPDLLVFREHWNAWMADPALAEFLRAGLLFVEQPLHRDRSLHPETAAALTAWDHHPPFIIDETDASPDDLPAALSLGYAGTSHKNCKGVVKSLAALSLLRTRGTGILSAEDLSTIPPVALLQDLAAVATLDIRHVERNGHHYFRGLSMFPPAVAASLTAALPELFAPHPTAGAVLRITEGRLALRPLNRLAFGIPESTVLDGFSDGLPRPEAAP